MIPDSQTAPAPAPKDRAEFERVALQYLDELYGTGVRLTGSRAEAEDLVQEAVMRAWAFWARFEQGTNARAWLHRILMNTFINGYRRRKREREILAEVRVEVEAPLEAGRSSRAPEAEACIGLGDEVERALQSLPEEFRTVVLMVDMSELTYKEVARALGCPIGTVMSRLHRARRALKEQLHAYARAEGYAAAA